MAEATVPGITGREFFGLLLAGYKAVSGNPALGLAMVSKDKAQAERLDFSTYKHTVKLAKTRKSRQTVIDMAKVAGINIA